jgi:hypothetical protein
MAALGCLGTFGSRPSPVIVHFVIRNETVGVGSGSMP